MKKKINIITLGCSKNTVDSENLATQLSANGIEVVYDSEINDAKTVVINTCGFIKDSKEQSIDTILQFAKAKQEGLIENLYVFGCLSERYKVDLEKEIPEVNEFFGVNNLADVVKKLELNYKKELLGERFISTPKHYAYLKISEGCDRTCSFCAIPLIRGKHISVAMELLVEQAKNLVKKGVKEIILIAQDLSYYGLDLYKTQKLPELLEQLSDIPNLKRIRLHYAYPSNFPEKALILMRERKNICNYIDIPLQHINNNVLKKMRRVHTKESTLAIIKKMREQVPGISIRTTMLVGHPGETEKCYNELKEFIIETRFDRLGVFTYSEEEDTFGAENFKDSISQKTKQARADELMSIQQQISLELNQQKVGKTLEVLIDRIEGDFYIGRSEFDSPEVDNEVLIKKTNEKFEIGTFVFVKIDSADDFDLHGHIEK